MYYIVVMDNTTQYNIKSDSIDRFVEAYIGNPFDDDIKKSKILVEKNVRRWFDEGLDIIIEKVIRRGYREYEKFMLALHTYIAVSRNKIIFKRQSPKLIHERYKGGLIIKDFKNIGETSEKVFNYLNRSIVGSSRAIIEVKKTTWFACFGIDLTIALYNKGLIRDNNVLIIGETGTGKELFAQTLLTSDMGGDNYSKGESIDINLASFPKDIVSSELFGSEKGAFTGAINKKGKLTSAHNGSIFLDEIGEIPIETQIGLLRAIETKKVLRLGGEKFEDAEVRYISATNKNISNPDNFRSDLYQRIAGISIYIPPLRERREDIVEIGDFWRKKERGLKTSFIEEDKRNLTSFLKELQDLDHDWPGNVRELKRQVDNKRMGLNTILDENKKMNISLSQSSEKPPTEYSIKSIEQVGYTLKELTDRYICHAVQKTGKNISQAAKLLDIDRTTVNRRYNKNNG
jgi:transcriptional regulator with PAS, ATPase and Fis domain